MPGARTVTFGVPVFHGELYLAEALTSIQQQTHQDFVVLISLDGADPVCEALCQPYLRDPRFQLFIQPERLGWVGNLNWLMARTETPYWCYHQQDDSIDPDYLAVLVDAAEQAPEAAVIYCDMEAFGALTGKFQQTSITGSAAARLLAILYEHFPAVAFRGVTRVEALRLAKGIPTNEVDSFACDTAWMAAMARWGELRRVPRELYRKRYHTANEHTKWATWPLDRLKLAWATHCAAMLEQAMLVEAGLAERRLLWMATVHRPFAPRTAGMYMPAGEFSTKECAAVLALFRERVIARRLDVPRWLHASWQDINRMNRAIVGTPNIWRKLWRAARPRF